MNSQSSLGQNFCTLLQDSSGAYFIDRDPKVFELILGYLRNGRLYEGRDGISAEQLLDEARFYGIAGLEQELATPVEDEKKVLILSSENGKPT